MPDETQSPTASLCDAIVHGTFPQSEALLTDELSTNTITSLLERISQTRQELNDDIRSKSKDEANGVDQWIAQAKKVQEDIAKCKFESKRIVEEHQQVQVLKDQATDYKHKADLLEKEIEFTETLRRDLHSVALATQSLREVEEVLSRDDACTAATKLRALDDTTKSNLRSRPAIIIRDLKDELRLRARVQLEAKLNSQIRIRRELHGGSIEVSPTERDATATNADTLLQALNQLDGSEDSVEPLTDKLKAMVLQPLRQLARMKMVAYHVKEFGMSIELDRGSPSLDLVFDFVVAFIDFLHTSFSTTIQQASVKACLPDLMALLVSDWLNPGLPTDLTMLDGLDKMQQRVNQLLRTLETRNWDGQTQLQDWIDDIHRAWLNKRKAATLDAVRVAFASSKGFLRQVERVERQVISTAPEAEKELSEDPNDWDASWDEDAKAIDENTKLGEDDDTSGWGFEDEDGNGEKGEKQNDEEEDTGDAWGWGDGEDESPTEKKAEPATRDRAKQPNGASRPGKQETVEQQEVTLTEVYSISEIPDHLVEILGRDISDAEAVQRNPHPSLDGASASKGLLALPTLALAMFRATAPSYYGASPSLTDIHRYNDSLYIAERLRNLALDGVLPNVDADVKAMEKFARTAYSKEMETQRIIVWDLLEGAQGFTSCTQFPYSQEIENAVSSVVDRIRTLHSQWKPVLSTSALMQSVGSLVTMVIAKVISSVEEMDDISEPESRRLTTLCQQIATLEDLFVSTPPAADRHSRTEPGHEADAAAVPMTAVYVANWLRFQYLINILESSLVDIKYLWTEGELSLEFDEDEVVDLIKALFAESAHRRSAIAAIKGGRRST